MNPVLEALQKRGISEVHYMADFHAMLAIATDGIRSQLCLKRMGITPVSIANPSVQAKRSRRTVDGINPLHEFVPFYFCWFTAMQREVESRSAQASNGLVFADVSIPALAQHARHVHFSNKNAASLFSEIMSDPAKLDSADLDHAMRVKEKADRPGRVMVRACELLIPTHVPRECISRMVCKTVTLRNRLLKELSGKAHPPIFADAHRYFRTMLGIERYKLRPGR